MSIAAKRTAKLMSDITKEDKDLVRAVRGIEDAILRLKGDQAHTVKKDGSKTMKTRFNNDDHKRYCTIRRMHTLNRLEMKLTLTDKQPEHTRQDNLVTVMAGIEETTTTDGKQVLVG